MTYYLPVNHFANITNGAGAKGVTLSNPDLAFARLGNSTVTNLDTMTSRIFKGTSGPLA